MYQDEEQERGTRQWQNHQDRTYRCSRADRGIRVISRPHSILVKVKVLVSVMSAMSKLMIPCVYLSLHM